MGWWVREISFEKPLKMLPRDPPPGCGAFFVLSPPPFRRILIPLAGCWKTICVAIAALKTVSKCSFTGCKLRFLDNFRLALAASKTFFNTLLDSYYPITVFLKVLSMDKTQHNYYAFQWHAIFLALAMTFTEINTVLPSLVVMVGGGAVLIGLLTAIMVGTPIIGQLLFASYLHMQPRKRGFLLLGIGLRVVALGAVALILLTSESISPQILIYAVFFLMFIFSLSGTFAGVSYTDILGKSLAVQQHRFHVGCLAIPYIPITMPGCLGWLRGCYLLPRLDFGPSMNRKWHLREMPTLFCRYCERFPDIYVKIHPCSIIFYWSIWLGLDWMPFYVVYASHHYGLTGEQVGNYLIVQITGMILSSFIWGKLVKKFGFRGVVRGCIFCGTLLPLLVLLLSGTPLPIFLSVFFLMGVTISARKIAFEGLLIEISTNTNRALYQGVIGTTSLTVALFPLLVAPSIKGLLERPVWQ